VLNKGLSYVIGIEPDRMIGMVAVYYGIDCVSGNKSSQGKRIE
jgi:hypothetical protein